MDDDTLEVPKIEIVDDEKSEISENIKKYSDVKKVQQYYSQLLQKWYFNNLDPKVKVTLVKIDGIPEEFLKLVKSHENCKRDLKFKFRIEHCSEIYYVSFYNITRNIERQNLINTIHIFKYENEYFSIETDITYLKRGWKYYYIPKYTKSAICKECNRKYLYPDRHFINSDRSGNLFNPTKFHEKSLINPNTTHRKIHKKIVNFANNHISLFKKLNRICSTNISQAIRSYFQIVRHDRYNVYRVINLVMCSQKFRQKYNYNEGFGLLPKDVLTMICRLIIPKIFIAYDYLYDRNVLIEISTTRAIKVPTVPNQRLPRYIRLENPAQYGYIDVNEIPESEKVGLVKISDSNK